jgi:hypothetical protein
VLLAAAGILILAFVALAFIGVADAHLGVERLKLALDATAGMGARHLSLAAKMEAMEEARFSASLLCLSKVQPLAVRNSQEPVSDESSSLVSVRPVQSKSHGLVSESA